MEAKSRENFPQNLLTSRPGEHSEAISVIAVCRNDQDTIGPLIDSVLAQGMENIELIIVDNGSLDNSAKIIAGRSQITPEKIRTCRLDKPVGNDVALRKGIQLANGRALLFPEPGAILCPGFLEDAWAALRNGGAEIVTGAVARVAGENIAYAALETSDLEAMPGGFLAACARGFSFSACLLDANHLLPFPDDVNPILALGCAVFAVADNIRSLAAPAVVIRDSEKLQQTGESPASFVRAVAFSEQFHDRDRKQSFVSEKVIDKEDIVSCASIRFPYLDPDGSGQYELSDFALAASSTLDWDEVMHGCAVLRNRPEFDFIYFYGKEASFCGVAACGGRELLGAMVRGDASLDPGKFLFRRSALPEGLKDSSHYLALLRILNSDAKGFLLEASFRKKLAKRRAEGARSWPEIFGAIRDLTSWLEEENLAGCIQPVLSAVIRKENLSELLGESCLDLDQVVRDVESVPALLTVMREKSQGAIRRREASDTHDVIMDFIRARAV